jgi:hypothetical protein
MAKQIAEEMGVDPLIGLLKIIKNVRLCVELRVDAMKAVMPFLYPKLSTTFVAAKFDGNMNMRHQVEACMMDPELSAQMEALSLGLSKHALQQARPDLRPPEVIETRALPSPSTEPEN